jgi:hypothetical protein
MAVYGPVRQQKNIIWTSEASVHIIFFWWQTGPYTAIWPSVPWTICYIRSVCNLLLQLKDWTAKKIKSPLGDKKSKNTGWGRWVLGLLIMVTLLRTVNVMYIYINIWLSLRIYIKIKQIFHLITPHNIRSIIIKTLLI